jgi:hypothetical protein
MTPRKVFLNSVLDIFIFGPCQAAGGPPRLLMGEA